MKPGLCAMSEGVSICLVAVQTNTAGIRTTLPPSFCWSSLCSYVLRRRVCLWKSCVLVLSSHGVDSETEKIKSEAFYFELKRKESIELEGELTPRSCSITRLQCEQLFSLTKISNEKFHPLTLDPVLILSPRENEFDPWSSKVKESQRGTREERPGRF